MFHVLNRGVNRGRIFFGDADRIEFGRRLTDVYELFGVETLAYCLMTNHYHLVVHTPDDNLSEAMHHLGSVFARHVNDRVGRDGPLFRGRFVSIPVLTDTYLRWLVRYVHLNPLDVAGVSTPAEWRWSSFRTYFGLRPAPDFFNPALLIGESPDSATMEAFRRFHEDERARRLEVNGLADIDALIALELAIDDFDLDGPVDEPPQAVARAIRVLVGDRTDSPTVTSLVEGQFTSNPARRSAVSRARARARREDRIDRIADRVVNAIAA